MSLQLPAWKKVDYDRLSLPKCWPHSAPSTSQILKRSHGDLKRPNCNFAGPTSYQSEVQQVELPDRNAGALQWTFQSISSGRRKPQLETLPGTGDAVSLPNLQLIDQIARLMR